MRTDVATAFALALLPLIGCQIGDSEQVSEEHEEHGGEALRLSDRVELTPEALQSLRVEYATAEQRQLSPSLAVPAELMPVPDRRASVGPRVAGRVLRVLVNVGDRVAAGAPLLVLESAQVGQARADLLASVARRDVAQRAHQRASKLFADRVTSERAVEEALGALQVAEADVEAARTRLKAFGAAENQAGDDPSTVVLRSPLRGTVVRRVASAGQWIEPSEIVMEIVDLDRLWLLAAVYEREMRSVARGQDVDVEVRAFPGEVFTGSVESVAPTLDERTRSASVRVVLPNPGHRLRPGMFATARIRDTHVHEPRELLAIPWAAVQELDGHQAVFVSLGDGVFEVRPIHTGERAGPDVEILNGVAAGETVVAEGSFLLKGQLLRATLGGEH